MRTAMFYGGPDIRVEEMPTPRRGRARCWCTSARPASAAATCISTAARTRGAAGAATARDAAGHELAGTVAAVGRT